MITNDKVFCEVCCGLLASNGDDKSTCKAECDGAITTQTADPNLFDAC